jgi:DNA polymerase-4
MLAKIASKSAKPGGARRVLPAEADAFIRDLPVRRLPGVGPRTEAVLRKLNIETIGALRLLSRPSLEAMFGRPGADLHERCRGRDTRAVAAREIPRSISRETSFHQETIDRREIEAMLYYLCERAGNTLRQLGLLARTVEVKIRTAALTADPRGEEGSTTLRSPTAIDGEIFAAALARYRALHRRRVALRLVGVALTGLRPDSGFIPLDLFGGEDGPAAAGDPGEDLLERAARGARRRARAGRLCESLDAIRARFGYAAVVSGRSIHLLGKLPQDAYGFVLRTPCLTR